MSYLPAWRRHHSDISATCPVCGRWIVIEGGRLSRHTDPSSNIGKRPDLSPCTGVGLPDGAEGVHTGSDQSNGMNQNTEAKQ